MNKIYTTIIAVLITASLSAQKDVYFNINHFLGNNNFSFNTPAVNNLGNQFKVSRLQYYISSIQLVHDGGQVTVVDSTWILVNANEVTNKKIGSFNITNLEKVKFAVGVESSFNHLDPSQYNMLHPLSPKSPSMHWGWASGYRFVAMEGTSGNNFSQIFEFHSLGDVNYFPVTMNTAGTTNGNDLTVEINADYEKAIKNIDISSGTIMHGETGTARLALINFAYYVFTSVEGNQSINVEEQVELDFNIYPNPAQQNVNIRISNNQDKDVKVVVTNLLGEVAFQQDQIEGNHIQLSLKDSGVYFVTLISQNGTQYRTDKLIITK